MNDIKLDQLMSTRLASDKPLIKQLKKENSTMTGNSVQVDVHSLSKVTVADNEEDIARISDIKRRIESGDYKIDGSTLHKLAEKLYPFTLIR